jgi:hypothetical protein
MTLVNDTWQDGDRTTPAPPIYSENGVDSDGDGDIESAWFNGGAGAVITASPGNLRMDPADAPATWTTYVKSEPAIGLDVNDFLLFTWRFRTGDVNTSDTGQNFRIAMVDSAPAARLTADGSPPAGVYAGLAIFGNMAETTGNANAFELRERNTPPDGALLEDTASWSTIANGLGAGAIGYADNTDYTFTALIKVITAGNLEITMTMSGGNIGGTGSVSLHVVDTTPISGSYDTFSIYVGDQSSTATLFDTSLFMVERGHDEPVMPEPASGVLAALGGLAALGHGRRHRRMA